jgi:hypothetical protein
VTDKIILKVLNQTELSVAVNSNLHYICEETLANSLVLVEQNELNNAVLVDLDEQVKTKIEVQKI